MVRTGPFLLAAILGLTSTSGAQQRAADLGSLLLQTPEVRAAVEFARAEERCRPRHQIRICEVEAPPFQEAKRAQVYAEMLRGVGLRNVRFDLEGNVIGERPGTNPRPNVVMSAHLDTVFPSGTNVKVRRQGYVLRGPGIGDDCRGLADLVAVARALNKTGVTTPGTITFVATVGEEGLGDLRGVKRLFHETLKDKIDRFVSIDGDGLGITHIAIGSGRYRVTFKGPGGHSFGSFGTVNPVHALGRAVARISELEVPNSPRTTLMSAYRRRHVDYAIASEAWMEVDLRSATRQHCGRSKAVQHAVQAAVVEENARWHSQALTVAIETVGMRPAGRVPTASRLSRRPFPFPERWASPWPC